MAETISPDYLIIGAGAMGMAFADTMVSESKATMAIVDRYSRPGGHWTIAYPHVTLHQPSTSYGVNSRELGEGTVDQVGLNKGYSELATGDEILAYFGKIMNQTLLPSGRVAYYPKHEYMGDGEFRSVVSKKVIRVGPNTRIVDATYLDVRVPAMGPPAYEVADNVELITPNGLATMSRSYDAYTVVGAGKTAVDACLWLLGQGTDPKTISWIMPRDSWFMERGNLQPAETTKDPVKQGKLQAEATMGASSSANLFERLEASGHALRVDKKITPSMFRFAIVSNMEMDEVRKIENIIRLGRVVRLDTEQVTLEKGTYTPVRNTLYIDCSAAALTKRPTVPVFNGKELKLQCVKMIQQVFSAAFIAHVEANYDTDEVKNELCRPLGFPSKPSDYAPLLRTTFQNRLRWIQEPKTVAWLDKARLDFSFLGPVPKDPEQAARFIASQPAKMTAICSKMEDIIKNDTLSEATVKASIPTQNDLVASMQATSIAA
ncbi:FAD-dependent pyridine nucleotide-disulfide oxidoreductase [Stemphylium lycopersici]|nr:FAD-dependent pyridine nucleotide-disulfide oxidoreductase [Stemphylium lycopersici]